MNNAKTQTKEGEAEAHRSAFRGLHWLRITSLWLLAMLAALAFASYVAVRWVERQILTTDNWVTLVSPLPKQEVVATALGSHISQQIIDTQDIESRITDALPPNAGFLAGPLASQVSTIATRAAQQLVASDVFQAIWSGANRVAMNRLLTTARGQTPPLEARINERFDIDISEARGQLRGSLGKLGNAIPTLQPVNQQAIDITADLKARPQRLRQAVKTMDTLYAVLPLVITATFLTALALSRQRRLTVLAIATGAILLILIELIGIKWLRGYMLGQVQHPENIAAVGYIFDALAAGLRSSLLKAAALMLIIMALAWAAGPGEWAKTLRTWMSLDKLRRGRAGLWWRAARSWMRRWKYYVWLAATVIVLGGLALVGQVTGQTILNALLLIISLWAATHIFATPQKHVT